MSKSKKKLDDQELEALKLEIAESFKYVRNKKCNGCMLIEEEMVNHVRHYEIHDKTENKRLPRKSRPHPIHNAHRRRREPDDTETDSEHEISHYHDPLDEEEAKYYKVEIISDKRNVIKHANKHVGRKHLDDHDLLISAISSNNNLARYMKDFSKYEQ